VFSKDSDTGYPLAAAPKEKQQRETKAAPTSIEVGEEDHR